MDIYRTSHVKPTGPVLDLGCGPNKVPGAIGLDVAPLPGVDVIHDLAEVPYPFEANTFAEVHLYHVLEHVIEPLKILDEVWRICVPGAVLYIKLPHFSSFHAWADPTHKRAFSYRTFDYLTSNSGYEYYFKGSFEILERRLLYLLPYPMPGSEYLDKLKPLTALIEWAANARPFICERFWCYWVGGFAEIRAALRVVK